ncbi:NAC domain-containing protein [Heracleum sosnowskyi]|uniref:NAC domain-containing protein n=1 Tax=Heracleum sosnowskyi TaxID=360622 RepID=A0AAD8IIQ4_9APIA|nr:NAC domain-containing protein [Heracleum sosnowskyi]
MAVASTMNQVHNQHHNDDNKDDEHDHDMVMPGFRFHPTEEELVEFYLRRKVEGKRFNVELITSLDLYRYDPWELPALAAIGEKEWYFYVPRDRKYRNGDRPNRVTTSGYWKATGADRMIRTDNFRSIGLKKTLVFYSGKAPKGIRSSWIMNEYRLPHHETERLQKAEISLCRVYKRPGLDDHRSLPRTLPARASTSTSGKRSNHNSLEELENIGQQTHEQADDQTSGNSTSTDVGTALGLSYNVNSYIHLDPNISTPNCNNIYSTVSSLVASPNAIDDLHRLISFQQASVNQHHQQVYQNVENPDIVHVLPGGSVQAAFPDRIWEWNSSTAATKDYDVPFK